MQVWNNSPKMNLPQAFYINIQSCAYFKNLVRLKTYHEVIQEVRNEVHNLEPRIKGSLTPSTAWCLLFKCFTLKLTENQLTDMLDNETNPYVRAMAMLYLRFTCPPKEMWDWFEPYLVDDHEFTVYHNGKKLFLAYFVKLLIEEDKFCDILLPRIPVLIHREMKEKLDANKNQLPKLPESRNSKKSSQRSYDRRDDRRDDRRERKDYRRDERRERRDDRDYDRDYDRRYRRSRSPRRSHSPDRYRERDRNSHHRDRNHRRDRYDRESRPYDRRDSRDRYRKERTPSPSLSPEHRSPSPKKEKKSNANLDKLKAIYGSSNSDTSKQKSYGAYGDSLSDDVVRIGF